MSNQLDVLFEDVNNAGVITLNRPKLLNVVTKDMVLNLLSKLQEWQTSRTCVIIKGAKGKAFCAGGDVKNPDPPGVKLSFSFLIYNLIYRIKTLRIPYVALIDGIAMGGGLGVSVHGRYRVATENTVVAMPETKIGLITDVGASYFLPRMKHHVGFYMGLTGMKMKGKDVLTIGIATHFVSSDRLSELEAQLTRCANDEEIRRCLDSFGEPAGAFSLATQVKHIDHCFSADTVEEILRRLTQVDNEWSKATLQTLDQMCPTMLKVTLRALRAGRHQSLAECLKTELRIIKRCALSGNLEEGVRALLIDKDNRPRWRPATIAEVSDEEVDGYFRMLPEHLELEFIQSKL